MATRHAPPPETAATLPEGSAITEAMAKIDDLFGDSGETSVVTLLFRGEPFTPDGLSQMNTLINDIVSDPEVGALLAQSDPVIAPTSLIKDLLQLDTFESVTQAKIDSSDGPPEIKAALSALTGNDTDGTPVSIDAVHLRHGEEQD